MPYRYGGYGGGYNPYLMEQAQENPFFNPMSETPDYWGGIGSILGNLWKQKQLQEQQAYERAMEERKMKLAESQAAGKADRPEQLSAVMEKIRYAVDVLKMPPEQAFRMAIGYNEPTPPKTPEQIRAEAKARAQGQREGAPPLGNVETTEEIKRRQVSTVKGFLDDINAKIKTLETEYSSLDLHVKEQLSPNLPKENKRTEADMAALASNREAAFQKLSKLKARRKNLEGTYKSVLAGQLLSPEQESALGMFGFEEEQEEVPLGGQIGQIIGGGAGGIMPTPQPAATPMAQPTGGAPPRPGTAPGEIATNKRTGQKFIWNGQSWQPTK